MRVKQLLEDVIDLSKRREAKERETYLDKREAEVDAINEILNEIDMLVGSSIENLVAQGLSETKATEFVMGRLSFIVMAHDVKDV
jgi:predicted transcriptional regulator